MHSKPVHIDKIMDALETLVDAGYVDAYNVMDGRQLKIVLTDRVSPVSHHQELEE